MIIALLIILGMIIFYYLAMLIIVSNILKSVLKSLREKRDE